MATLGATPSTTTFPTVVAQGRAKRSGSTYYSLPGVVITTVGTTIAGVTSTITYGPLVVTTPITIDQLVIEVTTLQAAKVMRLGIYNSDTDWQPTSLVIDAGDVSLAATGVIATTIADTALAPGLYLLAFVTNSTTAVVRQFRGGFAAGTSFLPALGANPVGQQYLTGTAYAGALPSTGAVWTTDAGFTLMSWPAVLRVKTP